MLVAKIFGCLFSKCDEAYFKRKLEEEDHYRTIKIGLSESMTNINKAIAKFGDWDELMNLKDESPKDKKLLRNKTVKEKFQERKCYFEIFGIIFCTF